MGLIHFTKMHGCGNDYIYINGAGTVPKDKSAFAKRVSDRHTGIGSDGVIYINPSEEADFEMEMYNADGSEGKMCGNGIRCVGKYVSDHGLTRKTELAIATKSGIKTLQLHQINGVTESVTVDMGRPGLAAGKIPVLYEKEQVINAPFAIDGTEYRITCVSMGNPHCVLFMDHISELPLEEIGPRFENADIFPDRVNTEFIQTEGRNLMSMRVWERGSGETFACGTGACAAAVAGVLNGLTDRKVTVKLLGGNLEIEYRESDGRVFLTGEAVTVYEGDISEE